MIISPSIAEVLRGVIHELNTSLKEGLDNPVKIGQIDTIVGVLSLAAARADHEMRIIAEESESILQTADKYVAGNHGSSALQAAIADYHSATSPAERYEIVSQALSLMADIGSDAGDALYAEVHNLMQERLANESALIGGGFEAAGR